MSDLAKTIAAMERIRERREAELQQLCTAPDLLNFAQALTDTFYADLNHLCCYAHLVDGKGRKVETVKVLQELQDLFKQSFKDMTGQDYEPQICRQAAFRKSVK